MTYRTALLTGTVIAGLVAGTANAQQRSFRSLDANGDGRLSQSELTAASEARAQRGCSTVRTATVTG